MVRSPGKRGAALQIDNLKENFTSHITSLITSLHLLLHLLCTETNKIAFGFGPSAVSDVRK